MADNVLDSIDPRRLGQELQQARRKAGLTQEDAARIVEVARTTVTAIEKGERRVRAGELIKLARAYGRQVSDFVRSRPQVEPFAVQFRGPSLPNEAEREAIEPAMSELEALCRDYLELEQLTGSPLPRAYPPEYQTSGIPVEQAAEGIAIQERNRLGLGDGPVTALRAILEQDVGLRIFFIDLPSKFSAIYLYSDQLGGCIAVNSWHPVERQHWSLSHEYGHFLTSRYQPRVLIEDRYRRLPESERLADAFASSFLMPTSGLVRRVNELRRTNGNRPGGTRPADLCTLANYYGVSVEAMTRRLEGLRLVPKGTWDTLRERGFKVRAAQQELGIGASPAREGTLPARYIFLAAQAFDDVLVSEGQLAHFLRVDRVEARRVASELGEREHSAENGKGVPAPLSSGA